MVRAQVEIMFGPDEEVAVPWRALVGSSHATTSYARFVRDHPYLPTYYEWLIKDSVTNLPTWGDVHHGASPSSLGSHPAALRLRDVDVELLQWTSLPNRFLSPRLSTTMLARRRLVAVRTSRSTSSAASSRTSSSRARVSRVVDFLAAPEKLTSLHFFSSFFLLVQVGPVLLCHAPDPRVAEPPPQVFLGQVVIPILHCIPAATFDHQN